MEFQYLLGVDIGKEWFNYCIKGPDHQIIKEGRVKNRISSINAFIKGLKKELNLSQLWKVVLVMEYTGCYTKLLTKAWVATGSQLSLVPASKISSLIGGKTGFADKSDQLDAARIAEYGIRYFDQLKFYQAPEEVLELLQGLQRQRERFIKVKNTLCVPLKESKQFDDPSTWKTLQQLQAPLIKQIETKIKEVEHKINELFKANQQLKKLMKLICSVSGIGPVTAREIILTTKAFTKFSADQPKAFARYSGVVPLPHESGKKRKRPSTSKRANRKLKSLLTMCAMSVIKTKTELARYYQRKVEQGKRPILVINNLKNKLILRVFAVIRNQVMYQ